MKKRKAASRPLVFSSAAEAAETTWKKFMPLVPDDERAALQAFKGTRLPPAIRLNPAKSFLTDPEKLCQRYGWTLEPVVYCPDGYKLFNLEVVPGQTNEHRAGAFYIQDSASMLPVMLFDSDRIKHSPLILDMAASPGGKTTHLVAASQDSGLIIANDSSAGRIAALNRNLKNWGVVGSLISNFSGEFFGSWFPETFDLVLLDAPCSMQSLMSIESHPIRPVSEREELALAQRQTLLLDSALRALKPGGEAVYSTCSLSPLEDEAVVAALLARYGNAIEVIPAESRLPIRAAGLTAFYGQSLPQSLAGTARLWPHRLETAGFFAALIRKNDSFSLTGNALDSAPARAWDKSGFSPLTSQEKENISAALHEVFGFDLAQQAIERGHVIQRRGKELWQLPERLFSGPFAVLPVKSAGMRIAVETTSGWMPDRDWVSLNFAAIQNNRFMLTEPGQLAAWLRGEDLRIDVVSSTKGTILFLTDLHDVFIGCGYVSRERIRNLSK